MKIPELTGKNSERLMTPQKVKIALRRREMKFAAGFPSVRHKKSEFQRERLRSSFRIVDLYLRKGLTVTQIATRIYRRHQRVSQVLEFGISYLLKVKHIRKRPLSRRRRAP